MLLKMFKGIIKFCKNYTLVCKCILVCLFLLSRLRRLLRCSSTVTRRSAPPGSVSSFADYSTSTTSTKAGRRNNLTEIIKIGAAIFTNDCAYFYGFIDRVKYIKQLMELTPEIVVSKPERINRKRVQTLNIYFIPQIPTCI